MSTIKRTLEVLLGLAVANGVFAAEVLPFTTQDDIVSAMVATPATIGSPVYANLTSTRVWVVRSDAVPNWSMPDFYYANAFYDVDMNGIYDEPKTFVFNGMPLVRRENWPGKPYGLKYLSGIFVEDWISWYAFFDPTRFPQHITVDPAFGRPQMYVSYPPPFSATLPNPMTIGDTQWSYQIAPAYPPEEPISYATFKMYPSQTQPFQVYTADYFDNPGSIARNVGKDPYLANSDLGWNAGSNMGFVGVSACNQNPIGFEGGKTVMVRACTLVVYPKELVVIP